MDVFRIRYRSRYLSHRNQHLSQASRFPTMASAVDYWEKLGKPRFLLAPMMDQSELPFRMLCRRYGATAAYTPMLHSRIFVEDKKYRSSEFTTCPEDRPLLVQFCGNDSETLLEAAKLVEPFCDYVDINLGCPQRVAKRGRYGAFLMDDLPLVERIVSKLASNLQVPVSCKIRIFPELNRTLAYSKMLESAGCSLLAVHGRTREQKRSAEVRADWEAIREVKSSLRIPVLANGNIRWPEDIGRCMSATGADGVLVAESILENPAIFGGFRVAAPGEESLGKVVHPAKLLMDYLDMFERYPVSRKMAKAHVYRLLHSWFQVYPDLREKLDIGPSNMEMFRDLAAEVTKLSRLAEDFSALKIHLMNYQ